MFDVQTRMKQDQIANWCHVSFESVEVGHWCHLLEFRGINNALCSIGSRMFV